ncbi:protein naked cuticle-like, partial [Drosophila grimshawi]|uniref:protein naked cuticle-like n=1 Tax=Drosophila grimshawi TaxID=7222 RepID=UPI001C937154
TATTDNSSKLKKLPTGLAAMSKTVNGMALTTSGGARRQHRHRPRKLIKSDDEDDDSNSDKEKELTTVAAVEQQPSGSGNSGKQPKSRYHHKNNTKLEQCCNAQQQQPEQTQHTPDNGHNNTCENMLNLKCCSGAANKDAPIDVVDCPQRTRHHHHNNHHQQQHHSQDVYMKQATQRVKLLRKARKQKYQDHCLETRQRSLSVGNDSTWQNRHLQQQQQQQQPQQVQQPQQQQLAQKSVSSSPPLGDVMLDGVQLRQPRPQSLLGQQQRKSAECWKSALNRNDLISIIRESMEKNRLCFQLNGKPQANVSPIRQPAAQQQQQQQQRQRCNTGSKIPTLIANHSPQSAQSPLSCSPPTQSPQPNNINSNNSNSNNNNNNCNNNSSNIAAGHDTVNNISSSSNNQYIHPQPHIPIYHQQLAINPAVVAAQHTHNSAHNKLNLCGYDSFLHATICGGGATHSPPATPSNVATVQPIPKKSNKQQQQGQQGQQQGQGYQRLEQQQQQQRSSKDYKNYGNLIYAKLSEQLQQKEREQRRQRHKQQPQQQQLQQLPQQNKTTASQDTSRPATSSSSSAGSKIFGDALECAHLLASEEEDELLSASPILTSTPSKVVSTNTLIDLNDEVGEALAEAVTQAKDVDVDAPAADADLDTSASSSMIHRYVHEHIHHHYHHFKEQNDV